jgi:hypothetical protein
LDKKDIVIGCITNYTFDKIETWVNSLDRSGFSGDKVMICYNIDYDTVNRLIDKEYQVFVFSKNEEKKSFVYPGQNLSICLDRFYHIWNFLKDRKGQYRYLISTDVRDVVFQRNPSDWLEKNIGDKKINVACESVRYKDESWGDHNLYKSSGVDVHAHNRNNLIYNAGTLSGDFDTMLDLFLNIFLLCGGSPRHVEGGGGPDQAGLNVLLNLDPYKNITKFNMSEDGWAAQLGTMGPQVNFSVVENKPILREDGIITTSTGIPFTLVHQYDRVPNWKEIIEKIYS